MEYLPAVVAKLRHRLQEPLPGMDAHLHMAPPMFHRDIQVPDNARQSAVLLLLYPHEGNMYIPFMKRTDDGRVHGGQISFPGGGVDPGDRDYTHTALREAEEEMGIPADQVEMLGDLTDLYIVPSNFVVHPKVGFMPQRPSFVPDPVEVAEIIEVEVGKFLGEGVRDIHEFIVYGGHRIRTPGYAVHDRHIIWGGTSMILAEFLKIIEELF